MPADVAASGSSIDADTRLEGRELSPTDAPELTALYEAYEWRADREVDDVRDALAETEVALGLVRDGTSSPPRACSRSRRTGSSGVPSGVAHVGRAPSAG